MQLSLHFADQTNPVISKGGIVGLTVGLLGFLLLIVVIGLIFYRRYKQKYLDIENEFDLETREVDSPHLHHIEVQNRLGGGMDKTG